MAQLRVSHPEPAEPPLRPLLADQPSRFIQLEREVEQEYRPQMLEALQRKVNTVAEEARATVPECPRCGQPMIYHDTRAVSWLAYWGRLQASPSRYRCSPCKQELRPLLDILGVEPGRICGSLARRLGLLAAVIANPRSDCTNPRRGTRAPEPSPPLHAGCRGEPAQPEDDRLHLRVHPAVRRRGCGPRLASDHAAGAHLRHRTRRGWPAASLRRSRNGRPAATCCGIR